MEKAEQLNKHPLILLSKEGTSSRRRFYYNKQACINFTRGGGFKAMTDIYTQICVDTTA